MAIKRGTKLSDKIYGTSAPDVIYGYDGNDSLFGGNGADSLSGGNGHDKLYGEANNDSFTGGSGNDRLYGGLGDDSLGGSTGHDVIFGNQGRDTLSGGSGNDTMFGGSGADKFVGGTGSDTADYSSSSVGVALYLGAGDYNGSGAIGFFGDAEGDTFFEVENVVGSKHEDSLVLASTVGGRADGGAGNDSITGSDRNDVLLGGSGDDQITPGSGSDTITGGAGSDIFWFGPYGERGAQITGYDVITDFQKGVDQVQIRNYYFGYSWNVEETSAGTVFKCYNNGFAISTVTLSKVFGLVADRDYFL